jgi:pimeloyl-ACP methyl ester carboxylesterase
VNALSRPLRRILVGALAAVTVASCTSSGSPADGPSPSPSATAPGSDVRLRPCAGDVSRQCGEIDVPLYRSAPEDGTLTVRFRVLRHTDPDSAPVEPIVAFEGGPGYGSIGSAGSYRYMLGPLLRAHDLILMDQRGTGGSGAIDCDRLQDGTGEYSTAAGECARMLGDAANAYGSAAAADDLAAILEALDIPLVDLYGDSYGTYLAQVFALRHPETTRLMILDGAYDDSFDPFARDAAAALRRSWATLCRRAGTCPGILGDITRIARRLERNPLVGTGIDADGVRRRVRLTAPAFAQLLYDATYVFTIYRDVPAAIAALDRGDPAPLLRLAAEDLTSTGGGGDPRAYSEGAYMAVSCHDYRTLWDPTTGVAERRAQLAEAVGALPDDAFSPLPNEAWLNSLYEYQLVYGCIEWPPPGPGDGPAPTVAPHTDLPVLVLNGELDVTTPLSGAQAAADAWPNATLVEVANEIHISALYDYERCASEIVRQFVRTSDPGDTSCASSTSEVHVVEAFPRRVQDAPQADPGGVADRSTSFDRRVAWTAGETVGDVLSRWWNTLQGSRGVGLRGGTYDARGSYLTARPLVLDLHGVRFVDDVAVSGSVVWRRAAGVIVANLRVDAPAGSGRLHIVSPTNRFGDVTTVRGVLTGHEVDLTLPRLWSA